MADDVFRISVKAPIDRIQRKLSALAYQQLPFATAQALTALARRVKTAEVENLRATFPSATPFTLNSIGVKGARKDDLEAVVFVKDIAAAYLEPYEVGGVHKLNSRALLNPKSLELNQFGNIPRGKLAQLKGRADVFVGSIKTKDGRTISGVWQRPYQRTPTVLRGRRAGKVDRLANTTGHLKLLVRFGDALPVRQHLGFRARAEQEIARHFDADFGAALARAIATSSR